MTIIFTLWNIANRFCHVILFQFIGRWAAASGICALATRWQYNTKRYCFCFTFTLLPKVVQTPCLMIWLSTPHMWSFVGLTSGTFFFFFFFNTSLEPCQRIATRAMLCFEQPQISRGGLLVTSIPHVWEGRSRCDANSDELINKGDQAFNHEMW